jgi:hypothetical protein
MAMSVLESVSELLADEQATTGSPKNIDIYFA